MMTLGVIGAVSVAILRPAQDNTLLIGGLFGFLTPTTVSILAFMKAQETHVAVNSRLDQWLSSATDAAHMKGINEGRQEGRSDADTRTDTLRDHSETR